MKIEFDVKVTEKDLYSFNIEQAYKGSQGVISLLFAVLLAAAAVLSAQKGNTGYVVLYIIVGILVLLYVPFSLKGRVKMIMKTNEVFSKPLHFEIDEKNIKVSQGEEMAQLPWEQVYRFVANDKRILIFSNRKNAYILSKEQLGDSYEALKELASSTMRSTPDSFAFSCKHLIRCAPTPFPRADFLTAILVSSPSSNDTYVH